MARTLKNLSKDLTKWNRTKFENVEENINETGTENKNQLISYLPSKSIYQS